MRVVFDTSAATLPLMRLRGGLGPSVTAMSANMPLLYSASQASDVKTWWDSNRSLLLTLAGAFLLLSPALRSLPRPAALTAGVLTFALVQMAFDRPPDLTLLEAVVALIGLNVISVKESLDGFRSEGVVAVRVMCAVAKGVQATGGLQLVAKYLLGSPLGYEMALLRMIVATMAISAFMNNTPVCETTRGSPVPRLTPMLHPHPHAGASPDPCHPSAPAFTPASPSPSSSSPPSTSPRSAQ